MYRPFYLFSLPNYSPYIRIYWDKDWEKAFTGIHERTTELPSKIKLNGNRFLLFFIYLFFILAKLLCVGNNLIIPTIQVLWILALHGEKRLFLLMFLFNLTPGDMVGSVYSCPPWRHGCVLVYLTSLEIRVVSLYTCPPWRHGWILIYLPSLETRVVSLYTSLPGG